MEKDGDDDEFFDARSELEDDDIDIRDLRIKSETEIFTSYLQDPFQAAMLSIQNGLTKIRQAITEIIRQEGPKWLAAPDKAHILREGAQELLEIAQIPLDYYTFIKNAPKKANQLLDRASREGNEVLDNLNNLNQRIDNEGNRGLDRLCVINNGLEKGEKGIKWIFKKFKEFAKRTIEFLQELPSDIKKACKNSIELIRKGLNSTGRLFNKAKVSQIQQPLSPRKDIDVSLAVGESLVRKSPRPRQVTKKSWAQRLLSRDSGSHSRGRK